MGEQGLEETVLEARTVSVLQGIAQGESSNDLLMKVSQGSKDWAAVEERLRGKMANFRDSGGEWKKVLTQEGEGYLRSMNAMPRLGEERRLTLQMQRSELKRFAMPMRGDVGGLREAAEDKIARYSEAIGTSYRSPALAEKAVRASIRDVGLSETARGLRENPSQFGAVKGGRVLGLNGPKRAAYEWRIRRWGHDLEEMGINKLLSNLRESPQLSREIDRLKQGIKRLRERPVERIVEGRVARLKRALARHVDRFGSVRKLETGTRVSAGAMKSMESIAKRGWKVPYTVREASLTGPERRLLHNVAEHVVDWQAKVSRRLAATPQFRSELLVEGLQLELSQYAAGSKQMFPAVRNETANRIVRLGKVVPAKTLTASLTGPQMALLRQLTDRAVKVGIPQVARRVVQGSRR